MCAYLKAMCSWLSRLALLFALVAAESPTYITWFRKVVCSMRYTLCKLSYSVFIQCIKNNLNNFFIFKYSINIDLAEWCLKKEGWILILPMNVSVWKSIWTLVIPPLRLWNNLEAKYKRKIFCACIKLF